MRCAEAAAPHRLRTMSEAPPAAPKPNSRRQVIALLLSNVVYLLITFGGSLNLYFLGPDFTLLDNKDDLPIPSQLLLDAWRYTVPSHLWRLDFMLLWLEEVSGRILQFELWLMHSLNLFLLWVCMAGLFFLTRLTTGGMWWLGSFAAVLLMANPLKSEAAMLLAAHVYLIPAALALWGMVAYASDVQRPAVWKKVLFALLLVVPLLNYPEYRGLVFLPFLFELLLADRDKRRFSRAIGVFVVFLIGIRFHGVGVVNGIALEDRIAPLFLIVYPIGILPSTLLDLQANVWLFWVYTAIGAGLVIGLLLLVRDRVVTFGILGAFFFRFAQGEIDVDLVHLAGGGNMLVPIALVALALAAICHRVMQHPKWPRYVVAITTVLCLVMIGLQIRSVLAWRHASEVVQSYRATVHEFAPPGKNESFIVSPAFGYYRDAPVSLLDSVGREPCPTQFFHFQWPLRYTPHTRLLIQHASDGSFSKISVPGKSMREVLWVPGQIRTSPRKMAYVNSLKMIPAPIQDGDTDYIYIRGGLQNDDRRIPFRTDVEVVEPETLGSKIGP